MEIKATEVINRLEQKNREKSMYYIPTRKTWYLAWL